MTEVTETRNPVFEAKPEPAAELDAAVLSVPADETQTEAAVLAAPEEETAVPEAVETTVTPSPAAYQTGERPGFLVADFDSDLLVISPPEVNKKKRKEATIKYDGQFPVFQLGTTEDPVRAPFGCSRWDATENKYINVKTIKDPQWAVGGKDKTGTFVTNLTLENHEVEGTQSNAIYNFAKGLESTVIEYLQQPGITSMPDITELQARALFKSALQPGGEHPPELKVKIRWNLKTPSVINKETGGTMKGEEYLAISPTIYDAETLEKPADPLSIMVNHCRGVWIVKLGKLTLSGAFGITLTIDVVKAKIFPPKPYGDNYGFV